MSCFLWRVLGWRHFLTTFLFCFCFMLFLFCCCCFLSLISGASWFEEPILPPMWHSHLNQILYSPSLMRDRQTDRDRQRQRSSPSLSATSFLQFTPRFQSFKVLLSFLHTNTSKSYTEAGIISLSEQRKLAISKYVIRSLAVINSVTRNFYRFK